MNYPQDIDYQASGFGDLYDELPLWSAPFGLMLLEQIELRSKAMILDVGAGTGFLTIELAQRCGAESKVIAVDPWSAAMTRLQRKVDELQLRNVQTLVQDAATIAMADESVDLIVSNLGINNFENADATLSACYRVAKPGAKLFLTTNLVGHMAEFYDVYRDVLSALGFTEQIASLEAHIHRRATVRSVTEQLERTGFEVTRIVNRVFHERFIDGSALLRHYFMRLAFVSSWKSIAPSDEIERTFQALESELNCRASQSGELSLTIPMACVHAVKPKNV